MRKLGWMFVLALLFAPLSFADSTTDFTFLSDGLGDIGKSDVFAQLTVTGYASAGVQADLFAKNGPPVGGQPESGLGLANEVDHEIAGTQFVQINFAKLFAAGGTLNSISVDSIQAGESYAVWGSNTAGQLGTLLGANQTSATFAINDSGKFQYISLVATSGDVDLDDATITLPVATPEGASTAAFLLMGLLGLGALAAKKRLS